MVAVIIIPRKGYSGNVFIAGDLSTMESLSTDTPNSGHLPYNGQQSITSKFQTTDNQRASNDTLLWKCTSNNGQMGGVFVGGALVTSLATEAAGRERRRHVRAGQQRPGRGKRRRRVLAGQQRPIGSNFFRRAFRDKITPSGN